MFEIFTLGDTQTFADILNGIAMMFSNSPLLKGNGPLQLGFGAFFGAMVLLLVMIYKAAFEKKIDWRTLLVPLTLYIILTVPKTSVIVTDVYSVESPQKIDNIPIGLAMPASVISGLAALITEYIEKAFYILPADNVMRSPTKLTEDGFLTPLQILNSIRYDNLNTDHPLLQQAFNKIYAACIVGNDQWNPEQYVRAKNAMDYMLNVLNTTERMVSFTVSQAGQGDVKTMSCSDAGSYIEEAMNVHLSGKNTDVTGLLGSNFKKNSFTEKMARAMAVNNSYGKLKGTAGNIKYTDAQVAAMLSDVTGMAVADSKSFMMNVLFDPMVRTASKCTSEYSLDQISKCAAWVSTLEQWKDRSAASGTSFLKKMKNGQNMMVLVGFMLFPFMVFMIMLRGMSSLKMVAGYVAFMLSNYLWLPMAAMINFYGQYEFQDAIYMLRLVNPDGFFTINQAPQLYDVVTTKLAVANNAMGMVPVLCSMLFGGMMWGMSAFAKGINPSDGGYDAKINSKPITDSAPLNNYSSMTNKNGFGATTVEGIGNTDFKVMNSVSVAKSKALEFDDQISQKFARLEQLSSRTAEGVSNSVTNSEGHRHSKETGTENLATFNGSQGTTDKTITDGNTHSRKDVNESDTFQTQTQKSANSSVSGDLTLAATAQREIGNKENGGKKTKLAAGVSIGADNDVVNAAVVQTKRSVVNQDTDKPTFDSTVSDANNIKGGEYSHGLTVTTENILSKIKNNKDADYKATVLNEMIQKDQTHNYTVAEKKEAAQLTGEIKSLSQQKSETLQWVISNSVSDREIAGKINVLAPNSKVINAALDKTDELGRSLVSNWEELKDKAESVLRLGGQTTPEALERVSIWVAAKHSGNTDVVLSALDAIAPTTTVVDTFREKGTLTHLNEIDSKIAEGEKKLGDVSSTINSEIVTKAKIKFGASADQVDELITKSLKNVEGTMNLTGQYFDPVHKVHVNTGFIDEKANIERINKDYGNVSADIQAHGPVIFNEHGKLIHPTAFAFPEQATQYDKTLAQAQKDRNNEEVIRLINEKNQAQLGHHPAVDAATAKLDKEIGKDHK